MESHEPPRMKILQMIQKNLATAGINPILSAQAYPLNAKILSVIFFLGLHFTCNLIYTFFEASTFSEYTTSIYTCSLVALGFIVFLVLISNVEKLFGIINGVEDLVNTRHFAKKNPISHETILALKYSQSKRIFIDTIRFEEKLTGIIIFSVQKMTPIICIVLWAVYIYFIYFTTNSGNAVFSSPAPMWLPFDWKNPIGFLIETSIQYTVFSCVCMIGACGVALEFGLYLYAIAMSKCVKEILFAVSQGAEVKTERKQIRAQLIEFMQFHSRSKQLISDFSDLFKQILMLVFVWSLVTICAALLMMQMELMHHDDDLLMLVITFIQIFYAFALIFTASEVGQRLNLAFEECNDIFDQFKWYLFSVEIQRMMPTIINFVQQSVEMKCFGTTPCDRETFKYVTNKAYSYFTVLRQFYD